jgi:multidrug efflux system membrane fusion protein
MLAGRAARPHSTTNAWLAMDELRLDPKRQSQTGRPITAADAPRSRLRPVLWLGLVVLLAVALGWWIHTRPGPKTPTGRFAGNGPMPVVAGLAQAGDIHIIDNALGSVTPLATVTVTTQIAGVITDVGFKEGQEVKKGDFLVQIDPRPYQAALDQAAGQLLRDQASLEMAKTDLVRYQRLAEQNSIARQQSEDQKYIVDQDAGTVKLDQAQLDNAKLNLAYCRVVAPISGRIGLRQVDIGNYVQVGSSATAIAVITQMQPITVEFTLPEDDLPKVMKRLQGGATLPVAAYDRSNTTKLADGTLSAVDSAIDPATGTIKLRAEFANTDEALFPSQFVNARLLIDTLTGVTVIPTAAVQRGQPGTFVYVIKPDSTVALTKITLGPQEGEQVAVTEGLSTGDKMVVDGADKLRDGAKVSLRQESAATDAAAPQQAQKRKGSGGGNRGGAKGADGSGGTGEAKSGGSGGASGGQ